MKTALFALVLLSLSAVDVAVAQLPTAGTTGGLGVEAGALRAGDPHEQLVQDAGVKFVRTAIPWWYVEQSQRVYTFNNLCNYDSEVNDFAACGIRAELTLTGSGGNPLPVYGTDPGTAAYQQGFSNFCAAAAARYKGKGVIFELWNEPNSGGFWPGGTPNADTYMALMNQAVSAMRTADPNCHDHRSRHLSLRHRDRYDLPDEML